MSIADSMKNVLKNKTHIFTDNWKSDLAMILKEVGDDLNQMIQSSRSSIKHFRDQKIKVTLQDAIDAAADGLLIIRILPGRITEGFNYFKDDVLLEIESLPDSKQKAIFSMKVIGALTTFTMGTVHHVKRGNVDFNFKGLKSVNTFSRFVVGEIVFKITRLLVLRFLDEVEKGVEPGEDLSNLHYFRELLQSKDKDDEGHIESGDPAIEIVENLKKYIMTGKRGIE